MKIASSDQMRELDHKTITETGIPGVVLMENAGRETVYLIENYFTDLTGSKVVIICGKGNNGGDGFVIGRHLWNRGCDVVFILLTQLENLQNDAKVNAEAANNIGIPIIEITTSENLKKQRSIIQNADILIDAILGIGLKRKAENLFAETIRLINSSDAFVVSVDIPSGLSTDKSYLIGPAVSADLTVTFGLIKPGLLLYPAASKAGQVVVVDISIPQQNVDSMNIKGDVLSPGHFPAFFSPRFPDSHKGHFGHLLIIAGSQGKTGAAILAANAAARSGTGLVTVAIPEPLNPILETNLTEVMTFPLPGSHKCLHIDHIDPLLEALRGKSAVLIGPGIGTDKSTIECLKVILQKIDVPLIIDADALNILAMTHELWLEKDVPVVITPHPGEFSRLTDISVDKLLNDQLNLTTAFAKSKSCLVVLKTARTLIAAPDGTFLINTTGNPGMATGGSGDILAGMIAGLAAQNIIPEQATAAAVFWHGLAGDITEKYVGQTEMLAGDIIKYMGKARRLMVEHLQDFDSGFTPYPDFEDFLSEND